MIGDRTLDVQRPKTRRGLDQVDIGEIEGMAQSAETESNAHDTIPCYGIPTTSAGIFPHLPERIWYMVLYLRRKVHLRR